MYINTLNKLFYSRTNDHITLQKGYLNIKRDNSSDQYVSQRFFKTFFYYQLLIIYIIFFIEIPLYCFEKNKQRYKMLFGMLQRRIL